MIQRRRMHSRSLQIHIGSGLYWLQLPLPEGIMVVLISGAFLTNSAGMNISRNFTGFQNTTAQHFVASPRFYFLCSGYPSSGGPLGKSKISLLRFDSVLDRERLWSFVKLCSSFHGKASTINLGTVFPHRIMQSLICSCYCWTLHSKDQHSTNLCVVFVDCIMIVDYKICLPVKKQRQNLLQVLFSIKTMIGPRAVPSSKGFLLLEKSLYSIPLAPDLLMHLLNDSPSAWRFSVSLPPPAHLATSQSLQLCSNSNLSPSSW